MYVSSLCKLWKQVATKKVQNKSKASLYTWKMLTGNERYLLF